MLSMFNITAELDHRAAIDDPDRAVDALIDHHPAASTSDTGRLELTISVPAETLRQAVTTGLALFAQELPRWPTLAVTAMPSAEFDRRNARRDGTATSDQEPDWSTG